MRKLIYLMNTSLDGYIEGPDGNFGWSEPDDELHRFYNRLAEGYGGFLYGRGMYETMKVWETLDQAPDSPEVINDFAAVWRSKPKYVFSHSLSEVGPNATLIQGDAVAAVTALKQEPGGDLAVGGPTLARSLDALIDEYHIVLAPVAVGGGKSYFANQGQQVPLKLRDSKVFASGVVYLRYERV